MDVGGEAVHAVWPKLARVMIIELWVRKIIGKIINGRITEHEHNGHDGIMTNFQRYSTGTCTEDSEVQA